MTGGLISLILFVVVIFIAVMFILSFVPVGLWISALAAGVKIGIFTLIGMRLRKVKPKRVVEPLIKARKAGIDVTTNQLESHYLAAVSYTHLTLPTTRLVCRSRWSPYH